jgi:type II secretory pathway pseudopilin PulG
MTHCDTPSFWTPIAPPRRAGMTLLEVILAITALAAISTLVTALWAQTSEWTSENAAHHQALRLEQTIALLNEQWEARVLTLSLSAEQEEAVRLNDASLLFVTSAPILHRDWPLVRVTYSIVKEGGAAVGDEPVFQLLYREEMIMNPASAAVDPGASTSATRLEIPLLEGLSELRWEQYVDESDTAKPGSRAQPPSWESIEQDTTVASIVDKDKQDKNKQPPQDPSSTNTKPAQSKASDSGGPLRAGRLVGVHQGEPFSWQFIAVHLR